MNPSSRPPDSTGPFAPETPSTETVDYGGALGSTMPESVGGPMPEVPGYVILGVLGRGGMGVVYKARDRQLKRLVALKMILTGAHAGIEELHRFRAEAEAVARLQHPGIVQIYEIGEHAGLPFLSLEFVEGGSLHEALTRTSWPARQAAELTLTLVKAIHYAHQRGVIHRDLKPANVLLSAEGQPKVSDFGLAKQLDEAGRTYTGQILGTPRYMAPEQAGGKSRDIGPHTDVYALGAILYELLTGRAPFRGVDVTEILQLVRTQEPVPPGRLQPGTPRDLETICLKCLQKEPARRYSSAAALADDLQHFLDGRPITARPIGTAERVWRWCRRNPRVAIPSILALLLLVSVAIVSSTAYLVTSAARDAQETALTEKTTALEKVEAEKTRAERAEESQRRTAQAEAQQRRLAVEQLVRSSVANGARLLDDGDSAAALFHFINALQNDPDNENLHRRRIAAVLEAAARPVHIGFHDRAITHVAFDPSGIRLVSAGKDGSARIWDIARGAQLASLRHKGEVRWAAFDAAGRHIATAGSEGVVQIWEVPSDRPSGPPLALRKAAVHTVFSPDGRYVAAAGGDRYRSTEHGTNNISTPGPMRQQTIPQGPGKPPLILMVPGPPIVTSQPTIRNPIGVVRVWSAADGAEACTVTISGWLNRVAFSPRDDLFATAGGRGTTGVSVRGEARIWSIAGGVAVTEALDHPAEVTSTVFSPDGRRLLTACGAAVLGRGEARVWDVKTGRLIGRPMEHALQVIEAAFSPDGRFVVTASNDATARIWEADTGEPVTAPLRHGDRLTMAAFSPDGRRVLTASRDGTARVWDAESGNPAGPILHHGEPVTTAAFAPDGRRVATATLGGVVRVWDLATAPPQRHLRHRAVVLGVIFSADGQHLISAPGRRVSRTMTGPGLAIARESQVIESLSLWDESRGKAVSAPLPHNGQLSAALLSPDGRLVLTVYAAGGSKPGQAVRVWQVANGKLEGQPFVRPLIVAAGFASDSTPLAVSAIRKTKDCEVQVWDCAREAAIGPALLHPAQVLHAALSADGRTLATVAQDRLIRVWDVSTGRILHSPLRLSQPVQRPELSCDGARLLTLADDMPFSDSDEGLALLWDLKEGRAIPLPHGGRVAHALFSADGSRVATASADGTARIWAAADGRPLTRPLRHAAGLTHAAFSSDGRMLATAGHDRTARLWDARTGEPLGPPLVHSDTVTAVVFSPDGRRLATACMDGGVRTWELSGDARSPAELFALAEVLSGRRMDNSGGLTPLNAPALRTAWADGRLIRSAGLMVSARRALAWHGGEADDAQRRRQWLGVALHVGKQIDAEPKQFDHHVRRGRAWAELGRWTEAAADFARAIDLGDSEDATLRGLALCRLAAGQADDYRASCAELQKRLPHVRQPADGPAIVQVLVLGPTAVSDYAALLETTVKPAPPGLSGRGGWDLHAAALLRAGKSAEAIERLSKFVKESSSIEAPWNWLVLALASQEQKQTDKAADWLQKAATCLDGAGRPSGERPRRGALPWHRLSWEDRIALVLLRQEAEQKVQGQKRQSD